MFHLGKVRKLDTRRVLRDIANEREDEWLPESWNKTKKSPTKYGQSLMKAWEVDVDPHVVYEYGFVFLISYFQHVVEPILHNDPWEAEYFEPVLNRAYEFLYTDVSAGHGRGLYDYDQKHTMIRPIIEAFAEAGMFVPMPHPPECIDWVSDRFSIKAICIRAWM